MSTTPMPASGAVASRVSAAYGLLGLPLAFVALPVYVHLPNLYAQQYGVTLAALGAVLLLSRSIDALVDPWLGRWGDRLYSHSWRAVWVAAMLLASVLAGLLWDRFGAAFAFYAGAVFCMIALIGLAWQPASEPR